MMDGVPAPKVSSVPEEQTEEPKEVVDENQITLDDYLGESILEKETVDSLMKEAVETEKKSKKKKNIITNVIFFAINIILMIFIVKNLLDSTHGTNFGDVAKAQGTRMWWIAGAFALLVLYFICETLLFYFLIKKTTGKRKLFLSYRLASVGKYYDCVTPTQLGGQPSQIIRLTRSGMGAGLSTSIPIIKLIVYNFVYTALAIFLYFFAVPLIPTSGSLQTFLMAFIKIVGAIGLIVTIIFTLIYFIIGNGKLIGRSFIQWLVRLGYKLHIVKDYRKTFERILTQVQEYQASIKYLNKNKGTLFLTIFLCIVECLAFAIIPFCIMMAFSSVGFVTPTEALYAILITMSEYYLCLLVSTCLPLPGGTGSTEVCFIFLFAIGSYSIGDNIVWALIFFRLITYYVVVAHGFVHIILENIFKLVKSKKNKLPKEAKTL